jgi:hypothetical protein
MRAPLGYLHPEFAGGLPGIAPSDRLRCSRLQLRGSAGIAPASLSSLQGKDAQTEGHFKERKLWREKFIGARDGSQMINQVGAKSFLNGRQWQPLLQAAPLGEHRGMRHPSALIR